MRFLTILCIAALGAATSSAAAQDANAEIRFGASFEGVELDENLALLPTTVPLDRLHKLSFEVLFGSPDLELFEWIGAPRPVVGATISTTGDDSWVKAALSWEWHIADTPIFVGGQLGATVHDGHLFDAPPGRRNFGCRTLLYGQATLGADIAENLTASLNFEHGSHAWTCGETNAGFNSVGFRLGYKF
jgi:lipid A 3-O-deacylase